MYTCVCAVDSLAVEDSRLFEGGRLLVHDLCDPPHHLAGDALTPGHEAQHHGPLLQNHLAPLQQVLGQALFSLEHL